MNAPKCNKTLYKAFLQSTVERFSGASLSEVSPEVLSHDSVSNWLKNQVIQPSEIWNEAQNYITPNLSGTLVVDDTLLIKKHSKKIELVKVQYSGSEHRITKGISLVNLVWQDEANPEKCIPVDFRVYDAATDKKSKNDHFKDMLELVKKRGLGVTKVVMDSWYSSLENLKKIRDCGWHWITGMRKNRIVNKNISLANLNIPDEGLDVFLRGYGLVKVFKFVTKNGRIDFIATSNLKATRTKIQQSFKTRWEIEVLHREIKQTCGIDRCQAHSGRAQRNHITMAFLTWFARQRNRFSSGLTFYQQVWSVIKDAISNNMRFILTNL